MQFILKVKRCGLHEGAGPWLIFCILGMALGLPIQMAVSGQSAGLELVKNGKTSYTIVHGTECTPSERYAAQELAGYLQQMTGAAFPVVAEAKAPGKRRIVVGPCDLSRKLLGKETVEALGGEEFIVRTQGQDLLLVGGRPRGTLYAACHFLDNLLGVRWWSKDAVSVPRKPELKIEALDIVQRPAFEMRGELFFLCAWDQDWSAHNRINRLLYTTWDPDSPRDTGVEFTLDEKHGGGILYPMPGQKGGHTFYAYLPRDKYFDAHPAWFAEINGKRTKDGQPCLTNPEVLDFITKQVLEDLRKNPGAAMVHVSQYDGSDNQCRCANCRKIDEEEGSPAGSLLRFVDAVAERVEKERPDVLVETYAYEHTQPPPKLTRPRANVVIQFCGSYHATFLHPFDAPENAVFFKNLQGWNAISPHLYIYDYMLGYLRPYPNLRSLGPNLRILAQNGVKGYMVDASAGGPPGREFEELRAWVLSRVLWNPSLDDQALIAEFVNGYYGTAGRYVLDYINLIHDAAAKGGCTLYAGGEMEPSPFVNFEVMNKAETLFQQAEQAIAGEVDLLRRVRRIHMSVQCMWAVNRDTWAEEAKQKGLPPPPSAGEFFEAMRKQALIELERARAEPIDLAAAAAAGSLKQAQTLIAQKGAGKLLQRRLETFLASVKKEMDQAPLKLCTKASSSYGTQAYQAFDGDPETGWSPGGTGGWIQWDMGKSVKVKAIQTFFGSLYTHVTYRIEASQDGKAWTPMVPRKTSDGNRSEDHPAGAADARFLRTTIFSAASKERPQGEWVAIMEQKIETE